MIDAPAVSAGARRAADLHDAAARWRSGGEAVASTPIDRSNVIRFRRGPATGVDAPSIVVDSQGRAPAALRMGAWRWAALLAVSATVHAAFYLPFQQEPAPMASIGEISVSVELVLGADRHAGLVPEMGVSEASAPTPAQAPEPTTEQRPPESPATIVAQVATPVPPTDTPPLKVAEAAPAEAKPVQPPVAQPSTQPQEVQVTAVTPAQDAATIRTVTPIEPTPAEPPSPAPVQAAPMATEAAELTVAPNPQVAETTQAPEVEAVTKTPEKTATPLPPPRPEKKEQKREPRRERAAAPERGRREVRQAAQQGERNRSQTTAPAAAAAGGVGRGRSDADSNYRGQVSAHLARHKRFPAEARSAGSQGSATVSFALDGGGRVTSVRLVRGSGVSILDQEATAMVRRASPFPAPPSGRSVSFTVPVSFRVN